MTENEFRLFRVTDMLMSLREVAERSHYRKPYRVILTRTHWLQFCGEQGPLLPVQSAYPRIQWNDMEFEIVDDR